MCLHELWVRSVDQLDPACDGEEVGLLMVGKFQILNGTVRALEKMPGLWHTVSAGMCIKTNI